MVKKIMKSDTVRIVKKNLKQHIRKKLPDQKPDTFERSVQNDKSLETRNLKFKAYDVEFSPEDIEKMKHMSLEEENKYIIELKRQGRYKVIKDSEDKS